MDVFIFQGLKLAWATIWFFIAFAIAYNYIKFRKKGFGQDLLLIVLVVIFLVFSALNIIELIEYQDPFNPIAYIKVILVIALGVTYYFLKAGNRAGPEKEEKL